MLLLHIVVFENVRSHFLHATSMLQRSYSVMYNTYMIINVRLLIILYNFLLYTSVYVLPCTYVFLVRGFPRSGVCPLYRFADVFALAFISCLL
jgi:hypothetical protein